MAIFTPGAALQHSRTEANWAMVISRVLISLRESEHSSWSVSSKSSVVAITPWFSLRRINFMEYSYGFGSNVSGECGIMENKNLNRPMKIKIEGQR